LFDGNQIAAASSLGGAIYTNGGFVYFENSTGVFVNNYAVTAGGMIYVDGGQGVIFKNSQIIIGAGNSVGGNQNYGYMVHVQKGHFSLEGPRAIMDTSLTVAAGKSMIVLRNNSIFSIKNGAIFYLHDNDFANNYSMTVLGVGTVSVDNATFTISGMYNGIEGGAINTRDSTLIYEFKNNSYVYLGYNRANPLTGNTPGGAIHTTSPNTKFKILNGSIMIFEGNKAGGEGGAIASYTGGSGSQVADFLYANNSTVVFIRNLSTFGRGGAIARRAANNPFGFIFEMSWVYFIENRTNINAVDAGGAISNTATYTGVPTGFGFTFTDSTTIFRQNSAAGAGGAIAFYYKGTTDNSFIITNGGLMIFDQNVSTDGATYKRGGAISFETQSNNNRMNFNNTIIEFSSNLASQGGAIFYHSNTDTGDAPRLKFGNSTILFKGNEARTIGTN
jgi:predicted outer membrane repeat protein